MKLAAGGVSRALLICLILAVIQPGTLGHAAYTAPTHNFAVPSPGHPDLFSWQGIDLESPDDSAGIVGPDLTVACQPETKGNCEDITLQVPDTKPSTLYVRISWHHSTWHNFLYAIDPAGKVYNTDGSGVGKGGGYQCDQGLFDKNCGNETTLPINELTVPNPAPGKWTIRVAAVSIHNETYTGLASLAAGSALQFVKESLAQLTSHLTRTQRVNLVFVGWTPSAQTITELKAGLPDQFQPTVATKQSGDCSDNRDKPDAGLVQHDTCHFTGTDPKNANVQPGNGTFYVPYFEPVKFNMDYHLIQASDLYARDLYSVAKNATAQDQTFGNTHVPATGVTTPSSMKNNYMQKYNAANGHFRGTSALVTDTAHIDEVDAFTVEDWIQNTRLSARYRTAFTDLGTGRSQGGQFINPDPNATRDPYWDGNGAGRVNVDTNPQGDNQGLTFFLLDTFTPDYAKDYFRPDHYHTWSTVNRVSDPDTNTASGIDNGRGWGARYRFNILDLGAAPSIYERANWLSSSAEANDGSAGFDPPVWQFNNDPRWNGSTPPAPTQVAGNTIGQVMSFEVAQGLYFKYLGNYLYRPIPADVYVIATNNWVDFYSYYPAGQSTTNPSGDPNVQDLYKVDMNKVYQPALGIKALTSASPYDTFSSGTSETAVLGCSRQRATFHFSGTPFDSLPVKDGVVSDTWCDDSSAQKTHDPRQEAIELAKSRGSAGLATVAGNAVPDLAVDNNTLRNFIDHNRDRYAPLVDGGFTVPILNIMFEKVYVVAIPLIVGGIAAPANNGEGWGQIDNVNDQYVLKSAIDCSQSSPVAPGCGNNPEIFRHDVGITYTVQHEAAHFLGLPHPHDGNSSAERDSTGKWSYYYTMLKWLYDNTASPTTYSEPYGVYEVVDQERLMFGHAAEYSKQAQDWLADGFLTEGAQGRTSPSPALQRRVDLTRADRDQAQKLFERGDYLHAMYAMRNAMLHAKGIDESPVVPHKMSLSEAATSHNAIFSIKGQTAYDPTTGSVLGTTDVASPGPGPRTPLTLPNTAGAGGHALATPGWLGDLRAWSIWWGLALLAPLAALGLRRWVKVSEAN